MQANACILVFSIQNTRMGAETGGYFWERERERGGEDREGETGSIVEDREGEGEGGHAKNRGAAHAMVCYIDRSGTELS